MLIAIGSKNAAKVEAATIFFTSVLNVAPLSFETLAVSSDVSDQPVTLADTVQGAMNRSTNVWQQCSPGAERLGIGLEGGLMCVPGTHTGFMNICAASVYDGNHCFLGLSSGFEHPRKAIDLVLTEQLEIRDAYTAAGLETSSEFSQAGGAIGFMTDQRVSRMAYCMQALETAYAAYRKQELLLVE